MTDTIEERAQEIADPVERPIADSLDALGINYTHDNPHDFMCAGFIVECKAFYTERTDKALRENPNIIIVQGKQAAESFTAAITTALRAEYERGQRDMRERLTAVAVEQCGGGFHDRKRLRSAIAALPITPAIEKEATTSEDYDRDHPWHEDSDIGAR